MKKQLENFIAADFLSKYWQKKPMVLRQAIPNFEPPVSANELAGLALEEDVESRLILEHGETPWELRRGPFDGKVFLTLPESHWTLLVQSVDHWVPEVNELLDYFRFLPNWRLEDIMISYAVVGGNVGPHFDQFDVFLIQAEGKRRWQVGPVYDATAPIVPDTPLHILSDFTTQDEYVLEPGDILYLPPGVGHHGVAAGECMTISIGFRAPTHSEILMSFTDYVADRIGESLRYSDPDQLLPESAGRIDDKAVERVQNILKQYVDDKALIAKWFGAFMTEPKHQQESADEVDDWSSILLEFGGADLRISEGSRLAYYEDDHSYLFADGEKYKFQNEIPACVALLCNEARLLSAVWSAITDEMVQELFLDLLQKGIVFFD